MNGLLNSLKSETHNWLGKASEFGFIAPGRQSALNFLFSEVGEALSEKENLDQQWARRQEVSDDRNQRELKLVKELCDVVMMACLALGEGIHIHENQLSCEQGSYDELALYTGQAVMLSKYSNSYVILALHHAVLLLQDMVPCVKETYTEALTERMRMLEAKKLKKQAEQRLTRYLDRASFTVDRYHEIEKKLDGKEELSPDEVVIRHLWEELGKRHEEYVAMANKKSVIVPDSDCYNVIMLYGQEAEKNHTVSLALKKAGFKGNYPEDVESWLVQPVKNQVGNHAD